MTTGRRRDPRAERAQCLIAGSLSAGGVRPRLVRDGNMAGVVPSARTHEVSVRRIEAPSVWAVVVIASSAGTLDRWGRQVLGAARMLVGADGGVILAVCAGQMPQDAGEAGADRVISLEGGSSPEKLLAQLRELTDIFMPRYVLCAEDVTGADLARRLAAHTGWSIQPGVEMLTSRQSIRPCRGHRSERVAPPARIITLPADRVAAYTGPAHEGRVLDEISLSSGPAVERVRLGPVVPAAPGAVPLAVAPFVMAAGQGVTDFQTFHALSHVLGATEGASRVVCDAGLMPRATQVGASGTVLDARVYLAFGIAGAPQHLQGLGKVDHVIAVNTDLHAAIVARAGLSIIADAQAVMPALLALLKEEGV